jgi:hypothetical protein
MDAETFANFEALCAAQGAPVENAEKALINLINKKPGKVATGNDKPKRAYTKKELTYGDFTDEEWRYLTDTQLISGFAVSEHRAGRKVKGSPSKKAVDAIVGRRQLAQEQG